MTVHLITVGLTVRDYLRDPENDAVREATEFLLERGRLRDHRAFRVAHNRPQEVANLLTRLAGGDQETNDWIDAVTTQARTDIWRDTATAELTTFTAVMSELSPGRTATLRPEDAVLLLASDTVEGLLAALWNAVRLTDGDLSRISYLDDPADTVIGGSSGGLIPACRGRVLIVRVRNLDLRRDSDLPIAMGLLGRLGRRVHDSAEPDELITVHLSGGYKAAIPFLIGLAEGLRSLRADAGEVKAFVVHETSLTPNGPRAVRVPLRRIPAHIVRARLEPFRDQTAPREEVELLGDELLGYAYEPDGEHQFRLTAFGAGLRELFDVSEGVAH